jgi:hypothetical protein
MPVDDRPEPPPRPGEASGGTFGSVRPETRLVPDRRYTLLAALGAVVALGALVLSHDLPGRVLAGVAVVVLLGYVASDLLFSPRLVVSGDGLVVNAPTLRARLRWSEVVEVRADSRQRLGLRSTNLEVDAGHTLAVFSKRAIGMDPGAAAQLIRAYRPPTR